MMKKKTFAMLAAFLCCGLLMTSCKDDDNNNSVTPEQPEQPEQPVQPVQPEAKLIQPENQFETKVAAISADPWTGAALPDPANPNVQKLIAYLGTHTDVTTYWTQADEQTLKDFLDPIIGK